MVFTKERKENKKDPSAVPSLFPTALLRLDTWYRRVLRVERFRFATFTGGIRSAFLRSARCIVTTAQTLYIFIIHWHCANVNGKVIIGGETNLTSRNIVLSTDDSSSHHRYPFAAIIHFLS